MPTISTVGRDGAEAAYVSQRHVAVPTLFAVAEADPLRAALDALYAAAVTFGRDGWPLLREEAWHTFPLTRRQR